MRNLPLRFPILLAVFAIAGFWGCGDLKMDAAELTARAPSSGTASSTQPGLDCASCHAYVLTDSNHLFHLFRTTPNYQLNGPITCLDCHATAIQSRPTALQDSIFADKDGVEWSALDYPVIPGSPSQADTLRRDYTLARIDTLNRNLPLAVPARPGAAPERGLTEWMTGLAHMNGVVDVAFEPRVDDTAQFAGAHASYNPTQESCSAIACHPNGDKEWGFASPSKGLPFRNGTK
jgi:hypothetical protein